MKTWQELIMESNDSDEVKNFIITFAILEAEDEELSFEKDDKMVFDFNTKRVLKGLKNREYLNYKSAIGFSRIDKSKFLLVDKFISNHEKETLRLIKNGFKKAKLIYEKIKKAAVEMYKSNNKAGLQEFYSYLNKKYHNTILRKVFGAEIRLVGYAHYIYDKYEMMAAHNQNLEMVQKKYPRAFRTGLATIKDGVITYKGKQYDSASKFDLDYFSDIQKKMGR